MVLSMEKPRCPLVYHAPGAEEDPAVLAQYQVRQALTPLQVGSGAARAARAAPWRTHRRTQLPVASHACLPPKGPYTPHALPRVPLNR